NRRHDNGWGLNYPYPLLYRRPILPRMPATKRNAMRRTKFAVAAVAALALALAPGWAEARAGGGRSMGSRGSMTYSAAIRPLFRVWDAGLSAPFLVHIRADGRPDWCGNRRVAVRARVLGRRAWLRRVPGIPSPNLPACDARPIPL